MAETKVSSGIGAIGGKGIGLAIKSIKLLKVGLAATSFAAYAYVWTWQFAAIVMFALFIHESGHVWAMRRSGIPTRGFFFIPFVGGAAVASEGMKTRQIDAFISLAGPFWGLGSVLLALVVYAITDDPMFAGAASWMAFLNLLNMLPVLPLDGGRLLKSIAFSGNLQSLLWIGSVTIMFSGLAGMCGLGLVMVFGVIGLIDLCFQYKRRTAMPEMNVEAKLKWGASYIALGVLLIGVMFICQDIPGADAAFSALH